MDIDQVMQAAKRYRELHQSLDCREVPADDVLENAQDDVYELAMFALSILPKGKRPVAMAENDMQHGQTVYCVNEFDGIFPQAVSRFIGATGVMVGDPMSEYVNFARIFAIFDTEESARLDVQWRKLDELIAAAR